MSSKSNESNSVPVELAMLARGQGFLEGTPLWETAKLFMYRPSEPRYGELKSLSGEAWDGWATSLYSGHGWGSNCDSLTKHEEWFVKVYDHSGRWCWSSREEDIPVGLDQVQWKIVQKLEKVRHCLETRDYVGLSECKLTSNQATGLGGGVWYWYKGAIQKVLQGRVTHCTLDDDYLRAARALDAYLGEEPFPMKWGDTDIKLYWVIV